MPKAVEDLIARRSELRTRIAYLCAWHPEFDVPEDSRWLGTYSRRDIESESRICGAEPLYREYLTLGAELHRRLRIRLISRT